jgi:beta-lactamase class A
VRSRSPFSALRWFSLFFIIGGVALFTLQLVSYSRAWATFPPGLSIASIPVANLDRQQAAERLRGAYSIPIEMRYGEAVMHLSPSTVGFELDIDTMLSAAELERTSQPFWSAFWNYLWGGPGISRDIPLRMTYSEERMRQFLREEVAVRYDHPPSPAMPIVGTINFSPGSLGTALDVERAIPLLEAALRSPTQRQVILPLTRTSPSRPTFSNLDILLRQTVEISEFDGLLGLYMQDLQTGQEIHFVYQSGQNVPTQPDAVFSASSSIKIPIMVSVFRRLNFDMNPEAPEVVEAIKLMEEMVVRSANPPADQLMQSYLEQTRGPLYVTEDMKTLGLENTFMAGYFYNGAPLLTRFQTPANQRRDINVTPDPYSQTTVSEMGMLASDLYHCAQSGGGNLIAVFGGEITQAECQVMMQLLLKNHIAVLIQAGVADGTPVAHKHGWVPDQFGVIRDVSDTAIIYTPGGNYVLSVFVYHPTQIIWTNVSQLITDLSRAVYNFYNLPSP